MQFLLEYLETRSLLSANQELPDNIDYSPSPTEPSYIEESASHNYLMDRFIPFTTLLVFLTTNARLGKDMAFHLQKYNSLSPEKITAHFVENLYVALCSSGALSSITSLLSSNSSNLEKTNNSYFDNSLSYTFKFVASFSLYFANALLIQGSSFAIYHNQDF